MREKKEINIQIGEQIKFAREAAKMTQELLAEKVNVSPQYISDLERGVVGISTSTLKRICTSLGVSSDQILFGQQTEDKVAIFAERCKHLTKEQSIILGEVIDKFIEAIEVERKKQCDESVSMNSVNRYNGT